jgi:adenylate kinase
VACGVGSVLHGASARQLARDKANGRQQYLAATTVQAWARGLVARRAHAAKLRAPIKVYALLGGPGSGKSTYSKRLESEFESLHHISVGELLRDACSGPTALRHEQADMIRAMMNDGVHVPVDVVLGIMGRAISRLRFRRSHEGLSPPVVLLDNYPLTETQRHMWEANPDLPKFAGVIYLDCSEETMIERVCARANKTQRSDDNEGTVSTAISHFRKRCKDGVVAHYQSAGLCHIVDSEGTDVDAGHRAVRAALLQEGLARDMVRVDGEWR